MKSNQSYFPSVRLIESLRSNQKKEDNKHPSGHVRNKSYAIELTSSKPSNEQIYPANTRARSKEPVTKSEKLKIGEKMNDMVELDVPNSPTNIKNKIGVINSYNPKSTNYGEFNKNVIRSKPFLGKLNAFSIGSNKTANKSSNNVESSFGGGVKSSNVSYEMSKALNPKEQSKSSNNLQKNIQVESLEEMHFFYVGLLKQNRSLAYKFEGLNSEEIIDNYEF